MGTSFDIAAARVADIQSMIQALRAGAPAAASATAATTAAATATGQATSFGNALAQASAAQAAPQAATIAATTGTAPLPDAEEAARIDAFIARRQPDSPLAGHGADFVAAGRRHGVDPRFMVAVATAESSLGTAGPGARVNNPFGWGPGIAFPSWSDAIERVAAGLQRGYLADGLDTIAAIQRRWAPVGASNDPANLNSNWRTTVSSVYADLGGDPGASVRI